MTSEPRCEDCKYVTETKTSHNVYPTKRFRCQRFPPQMRSADAYENLVVWDFPEVAKDSWCGEFKNRQLDDAYQKFIAEQP